MLFFYAPWLSVLGSHSQLLWWSKCLFTSRRNKQKETLKGTSFNNWPSQTFWLTWFSFSLLRTNRTPKLYKGPWRKQQEWEQLENGPCVPLFISNCTTLHNSTKQSILISHRHELESNISWTASCTVRMRKCGIVVKVWTQLDCLGLNLGSWFTRCVPLG